MQLRWIDYLVIALYCLFVLGVGETARVRDLWQHKDLGSFTNSFTATVPRHGVVLIRVSE